MFKFILFEWRHWLKSPMLWIFTLIIALLVFGATSSEQITIGGGVGSVLKNAPYVVQQYYAVMSIICLLMTTAFMTATANRDFSTGMYQFIFTAPIQKRDYFFGKFIGAVTIAMIPLLGVSIGALLGPLMPWTQPERYGPVVWSGHLQGFLGLAVPNTIIVGVLVFGLALIFRNTIVSFVGSMLILVLYVVSQGYTRDLEKEWLSNLLDPFGAQPLNLAAKYMTVDEKNALSIPLEGDFLLNRLLWLGISSILLLLIYARFSFHQRTQTAKKAPKVKARSAPAPTTTGRIYDRPSAAPSRLATFGHLIRFETTAIIKNPTFIIITLLGIINLITSLSSFTEEYGLTYYPVTYSVIDTIQGAFYLFLIGIITFYTGVLVWKARDAGIAEIEDATPASTGSMFSAKLIAMLLSILLVLGTTMAIGIAVQLLHGYTRIDIGQYIKSLLVLDWLSFAYLTVIALLFHYLINNRYIAYFAFVAFAVVNSFIWNVMEVDTNMLRYGSTPYFTYSDMNGYGPFTKGLAWFNLYWILFAALLALLAYAFALRGKDTVFSARAAEAMKRLRSKKWAAASLLGLFAGCAGIVYYNTQVLNTYQTSKTRERDSKDYELTYKKYQDIPQPRWVDLDYQIDIHPYERNLYTRVRALVVNKTDAPIPELHFTLPPEMDSVHILIDGARLTLDDDRLIYRIYQLNEPMLPGDTLSIEVVAKKETRGFENEVSFNGLTQNGTFINHNTFMPSFGYQSGYEISDKNKRKKLDLPARQRLPTLDEADTLARRNNYISQDADLVTVRTTISTAPDQTAVAPGSLRRTWEANGRRYFEYALDHPSLHFYSFISARFEVTRERWNDIDIEVYHIPEHRYNVPNMMASMKKSMDYYTRNFGPYMHKQCRIIEFPRYASFAQAFPGTMPYSEAIGFITDLRKVTEDDIDFVFYVVAHEMGHQYWAHQLTGANMRGSEMLSETFAEYAALMVMEREYGRDKMKKFLSYGMNRYLRGRGSEREAERPLQATENQGYIHYNKGSVAMYYLKEMIGEAQVNQALQSLLKAHAYQGSPYPTSLAAVRAFREVTPDSLQYLIDDLFEHITLFSNRTLEATSKKTGDSWEVTLTTQSEKFRADSLGKETAIPLRDYIDVGVFGKNDRKNVLGKPLVLKRLQVTAAQNTFTFTVDEKPWQAGIDPYNFLVDRIPSDNVRKVVEKE